MNRIVLSGLLLVLGAVLPRSEWALRCGGHIIKEGETTTQVRDACGAPFLSVTTSARRAQTWLHRSSRARR